MSSPVRCSWCTQQTCPAGCRLLLYATVPGPCVLQFCPCCNSAIHIGTGSNSAQGYCPSACIAVLHAVCTHPAVACGSCCRHHVPRGADTIQQKRKRIAPEQLCTAVFAEHPNRCWLLCRASANRNTYSAMCCELASQVGLWTGMDRIGWVRLG
jgi:hypothetical protein